MLNPWKSPDAGPLESSGWLPASSSAFATGRRSSRDGGTGTLVSAAAPRLRCPEEANVRAPDTVVSLHVSFINAGAELIETNTFGANRAKLASRYLEEELVRINEAGVKLARDARQVSGREVFIAGSIGPLGEHEETWPEDRGAAVRGAGASCSPGAASTCSPSRRSSTSRSS